MESNPKISIINLCFNTGEHVIRTLESIKQQTFKDFELIIVDDGSTDSSFFIIDQWLKQYADFTYLLLKNEKNLGITKSVNKGFQNTKGEYISLIADDLWKEDFLEIMYSILRNTSENISIVYSKANIYYTKQQKYEGETDPLRYARSLRYPRYDSLFKRVDHTSDLYLLESRYINDALLWMNPVVAFTFLGKREFFINGYDESYSMEDLPKWIELSKKSDFLYLDRSLATYIRHGSNVTIVKKLPILIENLVLLVSNLEFIKYKDTRNSVEARIALTLKKDVGIKNTYKKEVIKFLFLLIRKDLQMFLKVLKIIFKESISENKKKLLNVSLNR